VVQFDGIEYTISMRGIVDIALMGGRKFCGTSN
jgi:hypothetical protein